MKEKNETYFNSVNFHKIKLMMKFRELVSKSFMSCYVKSAWTDSMEIEFFAPYVSGLLVFTNHENGRDIVVDIDFYNPISKRTYNIKRNGQPVILQLTDDFVDEGKIAEDFWNKYVVNVYDHYPFLRSENVEDAKNLYFDHLNKKSDITIVYLKKSDINQHYSPVLFHVRHSDELVWSEEDAQSVCFNGKNLDVPFIIGYYTQKDRYLSLTPFAMKVYRGYDNNEDMHSFYSRLKKRETMFYIYCQKYCQDIKRYMGLNVNEPLLDHIIEQTVSFIKAEKTDIQYFPEKVINDEIPLRVSFHETENGEVWKRIGEKQIYPFPLIIYSLINTFSFEIHLDFAFDCLLFKVMDMRMIYDFFCQKSNGHLENVFFVKETDKAYFVVFGDDKNTYRTFNCDEIRECFDMQISDDIIEKCKSKIK